MGLKQWVDNLGDDLYQFGRKTYSEFTKAADWMVAHPWSLLPNPVLGFNALQLELLSLLRVQNFDPATASPTYGSGLPRTVRAAGLPVALIFGRPRVAAVSLYESGDYDHTDFFLAIGEGPLMLLPAGYADGVRIAEIAGSRETLYSGTRMQLPDTRSAHLRHLEPGGAELSASVWDFELQGWEPPSGSCYAESAFNVQGDNATVRVHVEGGTALADKSAKHLDFAIRYRVHDAPGWVEAGTYRLGLADGENGSKRAYALLQGGSLAATAPVIDFSNDGGSPILLNTNKNPGFTEVQTFEDALAFAAGDYDLRVELISTYKDTSDAALSGTLTLSSIEVEERSDALALRGLAYAVVTLPEAVAARLRTFTYIPSGPECKVWTGAEWTTRWSNNPIWLGAYYATHPQGLGLADTDIDWDFLKAEAAYCDEPLDLLDSCAVTAVSPNGTALTVPNLNKDYGGFLAVSGGEARLIYSADVSARNICLSAPFTVVPTVVVIKAQRFRYDFTADAAQDAGELLTGIMSHCRGAWWMTQSGKLRMGIDRPKEPAGTIYLDQQLEGSFTAIQRDLSLLPDLVVVKYRDQLNNWADASFPVGDAAGRHDMAIEYRGCVGTGQAKRLGFYAYNRERREWDVTLTATLATIAYEPLDVVSVVSARMGWGYDLTNVNAPRFLGDTDPSVKLFVVDSIADGEDDVRTFTLREYDASILTDSPGVLDPAPGVINYPNPFATPAAVQNLTLTFLGDLTDDGVWNPEIQAEWTHPNPSGVIGYKVYESRDDGVTWRQAAYQGSLTPARWRVAGFYGTLHVRVIPVGLNREGPWADADVGVVSVTGDTTPPGAPTGLRVTLAQGRLVVVWDKPPETDFWFWLCTVDDWASSWRVDQPRADVANPSSRGCVFRLKAYDYSQNASIEASTRLYLPEPAAPSTGSLVVAHSGNHVHLSVAAGFSESPAHAGWSFRWSDDEGQTWHSPSAYPQPAVSFSVPLGDFVGATLGLLIQYAEWDVFGPGAWSFSVSHTVDKPLDTGDITATRNVLYYSEPSQPVVNDRWWDAANTTLWRWNGDSWVDDGSAGAPYVAALWEAITGTGKPADGATKNVLYTITDTNGGSPSAQTGGNGDFCQNTAATGATAGFLWQKISGAWVVASDRTEVTLNRGVVLAGTVEVQNSQETTQAGMTGAGAADDSVLIWAGDTFANRAAAKARIMRDGSAVFKDAIFGDPAGTHLYIDGNGNLATSGRLRAEAINYGAVLLAASAEGSADSAAGGWLTVAQITDSALLTRVNYRQPVVFWGTLTQLWPSVDSDDQNLPRYLLPRYVRAVAVGAANASMISTTDLAPTATASDDYRSAAISGAWALALSDPISTVTALQLQVAIQALPQGWIRRLSAAGAKGQLTAMVLHDW